MSGRGHPCGSQAFDSRWFRARALRSAAAVLLLAGSTACGSHSSTPNRSPKATKPNQSATSTPTPTESSTPTPSATPTGDGTPFLTAPDLPPRRGVWTLVGTGAASTKPFGFCAKFDLASIGATKVSQRTFRLSSPGGGPSTGSAAEQLARFPDAMAVHRAAAVLTAWHQRCQGATGPIIDLPVSNGSAWWYVASSRLMDQAFGAVLYQRTMALVRLDLVKTQLGPVGKGAMAPLMSLAAARAG
ncbi:MAG: hypothetical protein M3Z50_04535 [Actinomycetota bacterium]|nr:hypothetical protein [Actinomycetota bacterium]